MNEYFVSTDKKLLNTEFIHNFLTKSYWAEGRTIEEVKKTIDNSLCFGVYNKMNSQVAFSRVVTDMLTFAYIADVFVEENHRGKGISKLLIENMLNYPELSELKRWLLITKDAHNVYKKFGFDYLPKPEIYMEILKKKN